MCANNAYWKNGSEFVLYLYKYVATTTKNETYELEWNNGSHINATGGVDITFQTLNLLPALVMCT